MIKFGFVAIASALLEYRKNFVGKCELNRSIQLECKWNKNKQKIISCQNMFGPACQTVNRQAGNMKFDNEQLMVLGNACRLILHKDYQTNEASWDVKCNPIPKSRCLVQNARCYANKFDCKNGFQLNTFDTVGHYDKYTVEKGFNYIKRTPSYKLRMYSDDKVVAAFDNRDVCVQMLNECVPNAKCFKKKNNKNQVIEVIECRDGLELHSSLTRTNILTKVSTYDRFDLIEQRVGKNKWKPYVEFTKFKRRKNKVWKLKENEVCQQPDELP